MSAVDGHYQFCKESQSDINEHLEALYDMACKCESIVEFGVRYGISSTAFIAARPKSLVSYDIEILPKAVERFKAGQDEGINCELVKASSFDVELPQVDAIFIDTDHSRECLSKELSLHGNKANKFLAFHDTVSFKNEIVPVIEEFMQINPHWVILHDYKHNNGLMILERKG